MPYFFTDAEIDISINDFLSECSTGDIKNLIDILIRDGHLTPQRVFNHKAAKGTVLEQEHMNICNQLATKFYQMSNEDTQILETLYKKYY